MGPYGSVGAHIKTGRSPMAQDHLKTSPDLKMAHKNPKNDPKKGAPGMLQAVFQICAWGPFAVYIYIYILETTVALKRDLASSSSSVSSFMA